MVIPKPKQKVFSLLLVAALVFLSIGGGVCWWVIAQNTPSIHAVVQRYCSSIVAGDYGHAYSLTSDSFQSQHSLTQYTSKLTYLYSKPPRTGDFGSCSVVGTDRDSAVIQWQERNGTVFHEQVSLVNQGLFSGWRVARGTVY